MADDSGNFRKRCQWRLEWLAQVALETLLRPLPAAWVYQLGSLCGGLAWHCLPRRRAIVVRNLRIAFAGELDPPAIRSLARESFRRTGANLFSTAHAARLSPRRLQHTLRLENPELLAAARAEGAGVVLLLSHMSNWELLARLIHIFPPGSATGAFYRPLNNPLLDARTLRRREADGTRMFSKHDGPHEAAGFLRAGGIVGILADQRTGMLGEMAPFFGRHTGCSPLAGILARRAKARVLALSLRATAPGRWSARLIPVDSSRTTPVCMVALEQAMRVAAEEVFWFQDRWRVYLSPLHPVGTWLATVPQRSNKPHRALCWLPGAPAGWQPAAAWFHPDVTYEAALAPGQSLPPWLPPDTATHAVPAAATRDELRQILTEIGDRRPLPLDFLLAAVPDRDLTKAARREGLTIVSAPLAADESPDQAPDSSD